MQPPLLFTDFEKVTEIVRADPTWQAAMRKRGIADFQNIMVDAWSSGLFFSPDEKDKRIARGVSYYRGKSNNPFAHPIEGVVAYVDLNENRVYQLVDTGVVPVSKAGAELDEKSVGKLRESAKRLQILQPHGPDFTVTGNLVQWQNWEFRFSTHPREGLILQTVSYQDQGRRRPILYRANLSEMYVPYGDPGKNWIFRNVFDEGEFGIGRMGDSLEPGVDVPENAVFFDSIFADESGKPYKKERTVGLYERDGGLLWKHMDTDSGQNQSRHARELVLTFITTVGNYDYGFNWIFRMDGTLEMEVLLTGIMQVKGVEASAASKHHEDEPHAHYVADHLVAVHHQHFLNFRLDMDVDGAEGNRVIEMDTMAQAPSAGNTFHTAIVMNETPLLTELGAQRDVNIAASRKWKIENAASDNGLGGRTAYFLVPGENSFPYAATDSWFRQRAGFINHHLWVTPYDPGQMNAAGFYPNQTPGGQGLPAWVAANRSIDSKDVVLWYTLGVTHIPRPAEWPVMPVHRAGFKLIPAGFFNRNPALDVPHGPSLQPETTASALR